MGKPVWVTTAGNLGTIEESVFYQLQLEAVDPDGGAITYEVISGYTPAGITIKRNSGSLEGVPKSQFEITGVPLSVSEDITSTFCCRATSSTGKISDRTFSLTVTGQDAPTIENDSSHLGDFVDGTYVDVDILAIDLDNEPITWELVSGELPAGLTLNTATGKISGWAEPAVSEYDTATVGWDAPEASWNELPWDHAETNFDKLYEFIIQVSDGKEYTQKNFSIFIEALNNKHNPVVTTPATDLGIYEHDNYFSYRFSGKDFDFDNIEFGIAAPSGVGFDDISGEGFDSSLFDQGKLAIPPSITLNKETGWLYGYIDSQNQAQIEYSFGVYTYKKELPDYRSKTTYFTLTVVNELSTAILWKTDYNLGTIQTGDISDLAIESVNSLGVKVNYSLSPYSRLPQGLTLLDNGLIIGRPSFETTTFDSGSTTFDENIKQLGSRLDPVTFDREFEITIIAASAGDELRAEKTFKLVVAPSTIKPYESLYLKASPGPEKKEIFLDIVRNTDIIPTDDIYRNSDPYFGIANDLRMLLLSGLTASAASKYVEALSKNHYRKDLKFSRPKLSRAYDQNRNVIYEVLYYEMYDIDQTKEGSVSNKIDLKNKINRNITLDTDCITVDSDIYTLDGAGDRVVYPNSLVNMRNQIINEIGIATREVLPKWMSNRQSDGSVIGWKPVVVLAYLKPGTGERILFNINRRNIFEQTQISFDVDRYIWDNNLSKTYNSVTGEYFESKETTFDNNLRFASGEPVAEVDYAVDIPFVRLHGKTTEQINATNGLDGFLNDYANKNIIFATQENFNGAPVNTIGFDEEAYDMTPFDQGTEFEILDGDQFWTKGVTLFDSSVGFDSEGFSQTEIIPGYTEKFSDPTIVNQRAGIWKLVYNNDDKIWLLEFQKEINVGETVFVKNGYKYGGYLLRYGPNINFNSGRTVPYYTIYEIEAASIATTFDNKSTRFISNIVTYNPPDRGDKYLVFPKKNIWC